LDIFPFNLIATLFDISIAKAKKREERKNEGQLLDKGDKFPFLPLPLTTKLAQLVSSHEAIRLCLISQMLAEPFQQAI
jgi:hypothetical protein